MKPMVPVMRWALATRSSRNPTPGSWETSERSIDVDIGVVQGVLGSIGYGATRTSRLRITPKHEISTAPPVTK